MKHTKSGLGSDYRKGILLALGAAIIVILLGAAIVAWMISAEALDVGAADICCMAIWTVASLVGNLIGWHFIRQKRLVVMAIITTAVYAALTAVALAFGSGFREMGSAAMFVALGGGISAIPELIGMGSGVKGGKNRRIVKLHKKFT